MLIRYFQIYMLVMNYYHGIDIFNSINISLIVAAPLTRQGGGLKEDWGLGAVLITPFLPTGNALFVIKTRNLAT